MSTKIYDGMIAVRRNPFKVQAKIKATLEPMFQQRFDSALRLALKNPDKTWVEVFDLPASFAAPDRGWGELIGSASPHGTSDSLYDLIVELQRSATHTFTALDFGYDVLLLPNGNGVRLEPLVLLFAEKSGDQYRQALFDAGVTREYGYWNNTDEPEGMSDVEWTEREKAWDKLDVPHQDGLSIPMPSKFTASWNARKTLRAERKEGSTP